jgi:hypothetical protein
MKTALKISLSAAGTIVAFSLSLQAQNQNLPISVNTTSAGEELSAIPASGTMTRAGDAKLKIKINNSCFGTNLRNVGNPLSPNSVIEADLVLLIAGKEHKIKAKYLAQVVTSMGLVPEGPVSADPQISSEPAGVTGAVYGNTVLLSTPFVSQVTVDSQGQITQTDLKSLSLKSISFKQEVYDCSSKEAVYGAYGHSKNTPTYACGQFMGKTGVLSASLGAVSISSDRTNMEINVSFPGQTGFCGGYWSPLMVFFDKQRPDFKNTTTFPLNPTGSTHWPNADHPGWFVGIDREHKGKIEKKDQLFGADEKHSNGFEVLKKLDSHPDGVIDAKDKDFKNLVLWKDKNGDGISQPEELVPLAKMITKISLKYKNDSTRTVGPFAEERQRSFFWYKDSKGKVQRGDIIDMWFAPEK